MELTFFLQQMINGVALGSLYGLIAIGYTMVYGIIRLINFAHGDVMMMGCYFAYFGILMFSLPWWASFAVAIVLTAALGVLMDKGAYLPVRNAPRISALITAIGVSFLLENLGLVVFGGRPKGFETPDMFNEVYEVAGLMFPALVLWTPLLTLAHPRRHPVHHLPDQDGARHALHQPRHGDDEAHGRRRQPDHLDHLRRRLRGRRGRRDHVGHALPRDRPADGHHPRFQGLCRRRLGGIGNITGAMLGGLLLGIAEILLVALMPELAGYRDAVAFGLLILILLFRPTGLMGTKLPD